MTHRLTFRAIFAAITLAVALTACDKTVVENPTTEVTVSLAVSRAAFRQVDGTMVRITVTNNGSNSISIPAAQCQTPFDVIRGRTTIVAAGPRPCLAIHMAQIIRPGESVTNELAWNGSDWNWAVQLKSGRYELRGRVFVGEQVVVGDAVPVEILSN